MRLDCRNHFKSKVILFMIICSLQFLIVGCIWTQTKSYYLKIIESNKLDKQVDKNTLNHFDPRRFQNTPLWELARAIYLYDYSRLNSLLSEKKYDLNVPNDAGIPLLSMSIWLDREGAITHLLDHGADPNFKSKLEPRSPVIFAAAESTSMLNLLLDYGGDPNAKAIYDETLIDERHPPETALSIAAGDGHLSSVEILVARGADINFGHGRAIADSITHNHLNITLFLLQNGFDLNIQLYPTGFKTKTIQERLQTYEQYTTNTRRFRKRDFDKIVSFLKEKGIDYQHVEPKSNSW